MKAYIKSLEGLTLMGKSESGHWVPIDAMSEVGGNEGAAKPMELVLLGLGGCTAMDVLSIAKKMHISLEDFKIDIEAENATDHPKVFTQIIINYRFYGKELDRSLEMNGIIMSILLFENKSGSQLEEETIRFVLDEIDKFRKEGRF